MQVIFFPFLIDSSPVPMLMCTVWLWACIYPSHLHKKQISFSSKWIKTLKCKLRILRKTVKIKC